MTCFYAEKGEVRRLYHLQFSITFSTKIINILEQHILGWYVQDSSDQHPRHFSSGDWMLTICIVHVILNLLSHIVESGSVFLIRLHLDNWCRKSKHNIKASTSLFSNQIVWNHREFMMKMTIWGPTVYISALCLSCSGWRNFLASHCKPPPQSSHLTESFYLAHCSVSLLITVQVRITHFLLIGDMSRTRAGTKRNYNERESKYMISLTT